MRVPNFSKMVTVAALFFFVSALPSIAQSQTTSQTNEIMTWVPPYAISESQAAVQADFGACDAKDGLTRIGLQFWLPNTDGTIKYHPTHNPDDTDVAWWTNWGQANGIKILLTIYNNDGSWNWDLARSAFANNRATFVNALISEMERLNLDGIDLDLEGIGNLDSDRAAFDQFVHDLWVELNARGKLLTINSFHYIWNAPNHNWWSDWVGEVDNIQAMGYDDLFEAGTSYQPYSFQQNAGYAAGYAGNLVLMGMPSWLASWGTSSGRGTSAQAHVQEVRYDLAEPTGIAIWDLQLSQWQDSTLWCEIAALKGSSTRFAVIGDFGSDDADFDERDVADLVAGWFPDFIITAGDNRYGSISMDAAVGKYYCDFLADAGFGSTCSGNNAASNAFFPSLGNHDYTDGAGISEYLDYFTLPGAGISTTGTSGSEKYYDFIQGPIHFFAINTEESSTFNAQKAWLQQQLAASTTPWQVVFFHSAPYSSCSSHGSDPEMQWPFASWGADAVIAGHDHTYERLQIDGIPYFVNGLGGMSRYSFGTPITGSIVRYRDNYGAMLVDASDTTMTFQFINVDGTVIDTYTTEPGPEGSINIRVAQSSDDAEELVDPSPTLSYATGHVNLTSSDLEMINDSGWHGGDQEIGIRFQNVNIPQGATILAAHLEFVTDEADSEPTTLDIRAQDSDDAATFSTEAYNISDRPDTLTSVPWTIGGWSTIGKYRTTPDLTDVVQEVIDRPGWTANNSMAFLITGSGVRTAESYDGASALAPLLHVEFDAQSAPNIAPIAGFTYSASNLTVDFTDNSTDSDGSVMSWSWDFDDGTTSTEQNPSHTYAAAGTYTASLTVTDDEDATDFTGQTVLVELQNDPPVFLSEPRWPYGYWPILSSDPENPHTPQNQDELFFAYDDDGVGCQTAPTLHWMYRPVALQQGVPVPVGDWSIEVPGWSFMYWVLMEEPTIADTTGPGLFEFKMSVTDCAGLTTDSEGFFNKRYYFQVNP